MSKFYPHPNPSEAFTPEGVGTLTWGNSTASVFACGVHGPILGFHIHHSEGSAYFSVPMNRETVAQLRAVVEDAALALDEFDAMATEEKAA